MPRPKVKDEDRKRVAKACDTCKRRKEKCDGSFPCRLCRRRNKESTCAYTLPRQRRGIQPRTDETSEPSPSLSLQLGQALAEASPNDAEIAIESLLTLSGSRSAAKTPAQDPGDAVGHAPVPKLARLLRDGHGKFIFVGDSSNLAFLQNIRRLARICVGESDLTQDPMRHAMIEAIPEANKPGTSPGFCVKPTREQAEDMVHHYMLASSGVMDLFDQTDILQHLEIWTRDQHTDNPATDAIFYLVLAIGARNQTTADNDVVAERYFTRGRELAVSSFMDDPSVLTVQSYILIAFYLLTACRRNGAFMLLGVAIRAAYALGLQRSDISALFEAKERKTRERVWKSLRVLDLFMSASLGRPPATSEVDGGNVSWEGKTRVYEDVRMGAANASAMLRICFIYERILNEVYCRREVDVQLVNSISAQYRDWNMALDANTDIDGLEESAVSSIGMRQVIGSAHLKCAYYWSIILLTRPFLIFQVSSKLGPEVNVKSPPSSMTADMATMSEACIDAALRSIEVASDLAHAPGRPKRPFMITNSSFVSALVIGLAIFGDYDKSFPLQSSLEQAKVVLRHLGNTDPAGRRYFMITSYLQESALQHIKKRDAEQDERRRQEISNIFGNLHKSDSVSQGTKVSEPDRRNHVVNAMPLEQEQPVLPDPGPSSGPPHKELPTLTTSGNLAPSSREATLPLNIDPSLMGGGPASNNDAFLYGWNGELGMGMEQYDLPGFSDEFPLISLMNDYTGNEGFLDML